MKRARYWSWYFSALFYKRTYIGIAHQLDDDLFKYIGHRLNGAVVADCGCGPGIVTEKFVNQNAKYIVAIDVNPSMTKQATDRLKSYINSGVVSVLQRVIDESTFLDAKAQLLDDRGFDIILFKRSLYANREQAEIILKSAFDCLVKGGLLIVIHGERSILRHAFGPHGKIKSYTLYHLFNRSISKLAQLLKLGDYHLYTETELHGLLKRVAPEAKLETIPSEQQAYNLAAIIK